MSYDDDITDSETFYDLEIHDYKQLQMLEEDNILANDRDFFRLPLNEYIEKYDSIDVKFEEDVVISADNFCSKFVGLLKDVEDIKFEMSKLKAEVQNLHNQAGIIAERLK